MKKNNLFSNAIIIIIAVLFAGCGSSGKIDETPTSGNIKISVDESYSLIMDTQVSTFEAIYTYAVINAAYKTEVDCITDLLNDSARVIVVNRKLTAAEEQQLNNIQIIPKTTKIAYDALALIIHKENKDTTLTYEQVEDIFKGKISKWSQINPASKNGDIKMVFDNNKSGNPRYFKEKFKLNVQFPDYCYAVNSNDEVINYVEKNPGANGIISGNWISDTRDSLSHKFLDKVKIAAISDEGNFDGPFLKPHQAYIADGSYPFVREVYMISREYFNGLGTGFVHFVAGEKGQRIILKSGLVPATMPIRLVQIKKD